MTAASITPTAATVITEDISDFAIYRGLMPESRLVQQAIELAHHAYAAGATVGEACKLAYRAIADR